LNSSSRSFNAASGSRFGNSSSRGFGSTSRGTASARNSFAGRNGAGLSLGSRFNGGGAFGNATFSRGGFDRGFGGWRGGWGGGWGWRGGGWGCCGFGWGFGWGFGLGWGLGFGWGGWGWDPWWWGPSYAWYPPYAYQPYWDWPPYGPVLYPSYPEYNAPGPYPYNNDYNGPSSAPSSDSTYGPYSSDGYTNRAEPGTPLAVEQNDNNNPATANVAISAPSVLVYLKDGTMLVANDYWLDGGQFHYTVKYGGESQIALDQVDVQKSIDENAKRGVKFTMKPRPAMASTPAAMPKPNAKPATLPPPPVLGAPMHGLAAAA